MFNSGLLPVLQVDTDSFEQASYAQDCMQLYMSLVPPDSYLDPADTGLLG